MTVSKVRILQAKYNMEILRDPLTGEGHGLVCESSSLIPELDTLTDTPDKNTIVIRELLADMYRYSIECPTEWFNRLGWSDTQTRYDAKNTTGLYLKLNRKHDADILARLAQVGNKQGYIKALIRNDIRTSS